MTAARNEAEGKRDSVKVEHRKKRVIVPIRPIPRETEWLYERDAAPVAGQTRMCLNASKSNSRLRRLKRRRPVSQRGKIISLVAATVRPI